MKKSQGTIDKNMRAISIRQPYVEEILRGTKKYEYRSRPTNIRGTVYLYAARSSSPGLEDNWRRLRAEPGTLPVGLIIGTVEIVDCKHFPDDDCYGYQIKNPKRFDEPIKPKKHPQPCWFFPF